MRILMVAYCFPPLLVPATMCYVKLAKGLLDKGHAVEVLAIEPESFDAPGNNLIDDSMFELVPKDLIVHRVRSLENNPFIKALKRFDLTTELFLRLLEPKKNEWTFAARRFLDSQDLSKFDMVLTCSQPHCNHLLGHYLKTKINKPWVAYFSDPWTDNIYASFRSEKIRQYHVSLESLIMMGADNILFTSQEMLDLVTRKFDKATSDKSGVLPHSFVPEWYCHDNSSASSKKVETLMVHTGHFYGPRTPMPFLKALERLHADGEMPGTFKAEFYGSMEAKYRSFIQKGNLRDIVRISETIPYLQSLAKMREADYLLLVDAPGQSAAESVFLPSKLIDYLGSRKPILGITPDKGASARVLRAAGHLTCNINDENEIYNAVKKVVRGGFASLVDNKYVDSYDYRNVAEYLIAEVKR